MHHMLIIITTDCICSMQHDSICIHHTHYPNYTYLLNAGDTSAPHVLFLHISQHLLQDLLGFFLAGANVYHNSVIVLQRIFFRSPEIYPGGARYVGTEAVEGGPRTGVEPIMATKFGIHSSPSKCCFLQNN